MASLNETLTYIAAQISCDAKELIDYAAEDNLGGYHWNEALRLWPMGSAWGVELQILYALIRHAKPELIVEIGGWAGASATHMALAVKANGKGRVISVDNGVGGMAHGHLIPDEYRPFVTLVNEDGRIFLAHQPVNSIDFLFEDADHSTQLVLELSRLALRTVKAGGLLVNHDAAHDFAYVGGGVKIDSPVGRYVREGLAQAGLPYTPYIAEPSDCGLAITVMPGVQVGGKDEPKASEEPINHSAAEAQSAYMGSANIESASEPPPVKATPEKKTRKRTPKAK